ADQMIYTAEKALRDNAEKMGDDIKNSVNAKIDELKKVKDSGSMDEVKKTTEALSLEMQKIGPAVAESSSEAKETKKEGEVKDAEFEEKKEDEDKKE
ncbi:MAG: Hsp70 family protein, partial [Patescibacteria group bacterium]